MLSVEESASLLGISGARVRKLIADGELHASKVGRSWVLDEESVMNRLAAKPKSGRPPKQDSSRETAIASTSKQAAELKELYLACKEAFRYRPGVECIQMAQSREEAAFYMAVADFFLKQKQSELVKSGVF